ncbi:hypothetical protein BH20GEM3_BH20GEM3_12230 [soil metagenome]
MIESMERRRHYRVEAHLPAASLVLGNVMTGVTNFTTETLDLSEGGAKIRVPEELLLAQQLELLLQLPCGARYRCRGRVLRSSPFPDEVGEDGAWAAVQFTEPAEDMRAAIARLVAAEGETRE